MHGDITALKKIKKDFFKLFVFKNIFKRKEIIE